MASIYFGRMALDIAQAEIRGLSEIKIPPFGGKDVYSNILNFFSISVVTPDSARDTQIIRENILGL